jgi:hypothetical protein
VTTSRHGRWTRVGLAILTSLVGLVTISASVAAHGPDPVLGDSWFAQNQALRFDWRSGAVPPAVIRTAITAAAADATSSRASQAATIAWAAGGPNPIGYGSGAPCGVNGLACFTRSAPTGFAMWFREQGHRFDWGTMKWCQAYDTAPNGCYDAETIALDEFGHVEGLDHHVNYADDRDYQDAVVQTFSRAKPQTGWNAHRFGTCDIATLQREYDVQTTSQRLSACLDLSTGLTLEVAAPVVGIGMNLTVTATLKIAGNAAYERLKGDLLSGRIVTLQRRAIGATTWTSVATMTSEGSGTYTSAQKPVVSSEYRAVFKTPTDEGLEGSSSAVLSVRVVKCAAAPCPQFVPVDASDGAS